METLESFLRDIRYVTRALLRTPAFFAVTVLIGQASGRPLRSTR
jgi:hypothetical protein